MVTNCFLPHLTAVETMTREDPVLTAAIAGVCEIFSSHLNRRQRRRGGRQTLLRDSVFFRLVGLFTYLYLLCLWQIGGYINILILTNIIDQVQHLLVVQYSKFVNSLNFLWTSQSFFCNLAISLFSNLLNLLKRARFNIPLGNYRHSRQN